VFAVAWLGHIALINGHLLPKDSSKKYRQDITVGIPIALGAQTVKCVDSCANLVFVTSQTHITDRFGLSIGDLVAAPPRMQI
jgi:hypothetical protein